MNEADTRAEYIDPALRAAGWGVVEGSRIQREYHITLGRIEGRSAGDVRRGKPLIADFILVYRNTKLAVIEAKAFGESLTEGLAQAKDYSEKLAVRYAYSTNGQGVYGVDMRTGKEGIVACYPSPQELWNLTFSEANAWRDRFAAVPLETKGGQFYGRYYQDIAIERVLEAIAHGKDRILLTLATGTGKTMNRLSDRLEAVSKPLESPGLEIGPRAFAPPAYFVSRRPQYSRDPGLQRIFRVP
jgi:type I restriction enzyme R subunit